MFKTNRILLELLECRQQQEKINLKNKDLEQRILKLENPCKFKVGDRISYFNNVSWLNQKDERGVITKIYWKDTDDVYGMVEWRLKSGWVYEVYFDGKYTRTFHLESDLKPEFLNKKKTKKGRL